MIDLVLLSLIGVSALLGLLRGFVGILVSTAAWVLAAWASFVFGSEAAHWLAGGVEPSLAQLLGGYALTFAGVMAAVGLVGLLLKTLVKSTPLSALDRLLGLALGALRGAAIVCVAVFVLGFTPLREDAAWRDSRVLPWLQPVIGWMHARMPEWAVPGAEVRKPAPAGDNARGVVAPLLEQAMSDALDKARDRRGDAPREAPPGEPANIEPPATPAPEPRPNPDPASPATQRP
ncbi:CvpA family protein [Pseudoxanthomonas mexicana]|uniref:CvpA family protein n=1 Tax=Pseudoxanthomonas mexicana TaxID=128785 RepID=UPI00398AF579